MRWRNLGQSDNVEDRRGRGMPSRLGGLPVRGKMGAVLLAVVLVAGFYGYDLTPFLGLGGDGPIGQGSQRQADARENELANFTSAALKSTEDTWGQVFRQAGREYSPAVLVLYSNATDTACGYGQSAMGPFYCPADHKVYIDLSFYNDMERKMGGGGDFALGYVLAHEIGHHVQNQLGISQKVTNLMRQSSRTDANKLSVRLELQADCFAGVWGSRMRERGVLERGDLEEALNTAAAIGDDRLQKQGMGRVVPDSFTHGTSQQRYDWFRRGYDSGDIAQCNTFQGI